MIVVERRLDTAGGHYFTQLDAIRRLVGERSVTFVAAQGFQAISPDTAEVLTLLSSFKETKKFPDASLAHDSLVFARISAERTDNQSDVVLFPSAECFDVRLCLRLANQRSHPTRFYLRVLLERVIAKLSDIERTQLLEAVESGQIVLLAETETMSAHLSTRYGLRFHQTALCLPCAVKSLSLEAAKKPSGGSAQRYRIGIMGALRPQKGGLMVPKIIHHLRRALTELPGSPQVDLLFQKARPKMKIKDILREYRFLRDARYFARSGPVTLCPLPAAMPEDEFVATLLSIDVLLLPYRLSDYRHRGSGIVLDGVAARKPIVHTAGMGMNEFLNHGNAEAADENPANYAAKVLKVLADLDSYDTGADLAANELRRRYKASSDLLRAM